MTNTDNNPMFTPGQYKNTQIESDPIFFTSGDLTLEIRTELADCPKCNRLTIFHDCGTGKYECTRCTTIR